MNSVSSAGNTLVSPVSSVFVAVLTLYPLSTVSKVLRQKDRYLAQEGNMSTRKVRSRIPDFETALGNYAKKRLLEGNHVDDVLLRERARVFAHGSQIPDFEADVLQKIDDNAWLQDFKHRHNILCDQQADDFDRSQLHDQVFKIEEEDRPMTDSLEPSNMDLEFFGLPVLTPDDRATVPPSMPFGFPTSPDSALSDTSEGASYFSQRPKPQHSHSMNSLSHVLSHPQQPAFNNGLFCSSPLFLSSPPLDPGCFAPPSTQGTPPKQKQPIRPARPRSQTLPELPTMAQRVRSPTVTNMPQFVTPAALESASLDTIYPLSITDALHHSGHHTPGLIMDIDPFAYSNGKHFSMPPPPLPTQQSSQSPTAPTPNSSSSSSGVGSPSREDAFRAMQTVMKFFSEQPGASAEDFATIARLMTRLNRGQSSKNSPLSPDMHTIHELDTTMQG